MKPIVYVDMDGVLCDIKKKAREQFRKCPEMKYPQSQYGFFMELEEIPDAVKSVKMLDTVFDIAFATAPSVPNPMSYAEKNYWIRMHFGQEWCDRLYIVPDKSRLIGDYLIDDNASGRGQDKFKGELIHFTSDKTWKSITDYLLAKHGFLHLGIEKM